MEHSEYDEAASYNTTTEAYLASIRMEEVGALLKETFVRLLPANNVMYNEPLRAQVASLDRQGIWVIVDEIFEACPEEIRLPALFCCSRCRGVHDRARLRVSCFRLKLAFGSSGWAYFLNSSALRNPKGSLRAYLQRPWVP